MNGGVPGSRGVTQHASTILSILPVTAGHGGVGAGVDLGSRGSVSAGVPHDQ